MKQIPEAELLAFIAMQNSPVEFIKTMWGLTPQPLKEGISPDLPASEYRPAAFQPFEPGRHITWQQWLILRAVEYALAGKAPKRISIRSGHGIGKSAILSMLIPWFLFCYKDSQIPCTAPTSDQIHDILWKELAKWKKKLPAQVQDKFEWTSDYMRVTESPETWFARARTARKEQPEALAGVHADNVMYLADEASGIDDAIFNTAEGALTNENILFLMISNGTRLLGYFYDSHHKDAENWQLLAFNSEESPIVDKAYVSRIISKFGKDSDDYRVRVLGEFPVADAMDDKGYVPLVLQEDVRQIHDAAFSGGTQKFLGVDPSGEGDDETTWVLRDDFKAKVLAKEKISNSKSIAQKTMTLMEEHDIPPRNVFIDNFGEGANVAQEIALAGYRINAVNVGDKADEEERFMNKRAENFWRVKQWLRKGGELVYNSGWDELLVIRYRAELSGKLRIMSKKEMREMGIKSPNIADGLMLTFHRQDMVNRILRKVNDLMPKKKVDKKKSYSMRMV